MKAISLWQPYASLVACGLKRVETRSWPTKYRGPILIHAGKRWTPELEATARHFRERFSWRTYVPSVGALPLGAVVAVARITECHEMDRAWIEAQSPLERAAGVWLPGRFGWVLEDVRAPGAPIPLKGRQGLFEVNADEIEALSRASLVAAYEGAPALEGRVVT